ncbi:MAG: SHOCT domain-containing protein [Candidatus Altiarchaeales archaeon]|nr:SHOCT domain-containing protein [Candidatus Altiarchaeota archaeon]MCG2783220.1 SHOCT domain-containing protein [Candidatus Altiarchaeales archaeon]
MDYSIGLRGAGRHMLFGIIPAPLVWNFLIILIIALIFYWLARGSRTNETATDILKKRYAAGEIDKKTFEQMKKDIAD